MKLHELKPPKGSTSERRRIGRGLGSGRGKTSGKGHKGQKARSGGGVPLYFEGGQLPLVRRLPYRRGFNNPFRIEYEVVNLDQLEAIEGTTSVDPDGLRSRGVIRTNKKPLKVLARGSITKALTVRAHKFSQAAEAAIQKAGGKIEVISAADQTETKKAEQAKIRQAKTAKVTRE
jgi:large subunit ribosomal protein L15